MPTNQATKLYLFNMTEYESVAYFDSDTYFRQDPHQCIAACKSKHALCAAANRQDGLHGASYFNAGVMVIRPNRMLFRCLHANYQAGASRPYCEQDMLNDFFCSRDGSRCSSAVGWLPQRCNVQAPSYHSFAAGSTAVVIHEVAALVKPHWLESWPAELRWRVFSRSNASLIPPGHATRHRVIAMQRSLFMGNLKTRRANRQPTKGGATAGSASPDTASWHSCESVRHLQLLKNLTQPSAPRERPRPQPIALPRPRPQPIALPRRLPQPQRPRQRRQPSLSQSVCSAPTRT